MSLPLLGFLVIGLDFFHKLLAKLAKGKGVLKASVLDPQIVDRSDDIGHGDAGDSPSLLVASEGVAHRPARDRRSHSAAADMLEQEVLLRNVLKHEMGRDQDGTTDHN